MPHIIKISPNSDMSVIWINIWDLQKGSKNKILINYLFNFGHYTATVRETVMYSGVVLYASPPIQKLHPCSDIISKLYKPIFHSSHLSHNMFYDSATTIWVFYFP